MRDCEHIQQISAYHDGELSSEDRRLVEAHVERCDACARELRQLRSLSRLLTDVPVLDMPVEVRQRLHDNVASVNERVIVTLARRLSAAAAAILVVCAAWTYVDRVRGQEANTAASQWELAAVTLEDDPSASEAQQIGQWIVQDLSLGNGHD